MSQAAVETAASVALKEYFGFNSDDSDESVTDSPERHSVNETSPVKPDVPDCSKSSSGVSENSFSSPESGEILKIDLPKLQRRPPATRISSSESDQSDGSPIKVFTEEELLGGDYDFLDEDDIDSEEEDALLNEDLNETKDMDEDDLGFHEVSPLKRERIEIAADMSDTSIGVSPKRARLDLKENEERKEEEEEREEIEDVRDSSATGDATGDALSSLFVLDEVVEKVDHEEEVQEERHELSLGSEEGEEEDEDTFDVGGVEWNFSSRTAEYLTLAVFIDDIYSVILAREKGCQSNVFEERPEDIDDTLRKEFIETLLSRKEMLKLSLTTVHLSIRLLDTFLYEHVCDRKGFIGVSVVAVVLASKMEEYESCRFSAVARIIYPFEEEMEVNRLKGLEKMLYSVFDFDIDTPTAFLVANIFHTIVVSNKQQVHLANYLLELSLLDWSISQHRPTVLAHAAVTLSHALTREEIERDSMKYLSEVDSLFSVERRLAQFSKMEESRVVAARLLQLFEAAPDDASSTYDRYSTESELYVAFFEVSDSLKRALVIKGPPSP